MLFGVRAPREKEVLDFIKEFKANSEIEDLKKNPYNNHRFKTVLSEKTIFFVIGMEPVYPDLSMMGVYVAVLSFLIWIIFSRFFWPILAVGGFIYLANKFMRGSVFHYLVVKLAMRRRGVRGIKFVWNKKDLEVVYDA